MKQQPHEFYDKYNICVEKAAEITFVLDLDELFYLILVSLKFSIQSLIIIILLVLYC